MTKKEQSEVKHLKCCKRSSTYKPNVIRTHPFRWIHFPIFVGIWFILFWFVISPIVWSKVHALPKTDWPSQWSYYFWSVALLIFCAILGILLLIWKLIVPKEKSKYDQIFLNPEYGDEKEILCIHCMTFHPPGGARCPCTFVDACPNCGNPKESFGTCCQKPKKTEEQVKGPEYDVTLRKQQPENEKFDKEVKPADKRHSLRSTRSRHDSSSGGGIVVLSSAHNAGTRNLVISKKPTDITKTIKVQTKAVDDLEKSGEKPAKPKNETAIDTTDRVSRIKSKKPLNLQPVDVDLANRHGEVEFFGEKIPLKSTSQETKADVHFTNTCQPDSSDEDGRAELKSVSSLETMKTEKFNEYLHLVEINTPFTPAETIVKEEMPPLSPREIFFYDLIHAADNCGDGNSPDSTHFGFYHRLEKKRPVSHILVTSDVNLDEETDKAKLDALKRHTINFNAKSSSNALRDRRPVENLESPKILELTEAIKLHTSEGDDTEEKTIIRNDDDKKTTVKILRTIKKSTPEAEILNNPLFGARKSYAMPEQNSTKELRPTRESVSKYFISDIRSSPKKPARQISRESTSQNASTSRDDVNDDVFTN